MRFVCALALAAFTGSCGGENAEVTTDQQAAEAKATADSLLDMLNATTDSLMATGDSTGTTTEHTEEAAH